MGEVEQAIAAMAAGQQGPQLTLAAPLNDTQLVCLVAAHLYADSTGAEDAVDTAMDIVAAAIVSLGPGGANLQRRVQQMLEGGR